MLRLGSSWVWDFWLADDGDLFHLFFLKAPRALGDPDRRHRHATVGHAVSLDLTDWVEVADALTPSPGPAFDDLAIWTGSVVRDGSGWRMFYTGIDRADRGRVQRIGAAVSDDLLTWTRVSSEPLLVADRRWYATASAGEPAATGGVVGHATSPDLRTWTVRPPLSRPAGFGQLEVVLAEVVDGRPVLLFSCMTAELGDARREAGERGGIWVVEADRLLGPYDVGQAHLLHDESLYVGRLVRRRNGEWCLLAFRNLAPGGFVGEIADPIPVRWAADGRLALEA